MRNLVRNWQSLLAILLASLWLAACGPVSNTSEPVTVTSHQAVVATATTQATTPPTPVPTAAGTSPPVAVEKTPSASPVETQTPEPLSSLTDPPTGCPAGSNEDVTLLPAAEGRTIVEMFEPPILAYLNAGGHPQALEADLDRLTLDDGEQTWKAANAVHHTDVTGDGTPEVIVDLLFYVEGQFADGGLFVFRCLAGEYVGGAVVRIGAQLFADQGPEPVVQTIQDMNGNGRPDILLSYITVIGTHANFTREFRILEWDGGRFVDLIQSDGDRPYAAKVLNGNGVVCDTDGDAILELKLIHGPGHGPDADGSGCAPVDVWSWNGEAFVLAHTEPCPPPGFL